MDGIVLNRDGHYFTPNGNDVDEFGGSCQAAKVVKVHGNGEAVNLAVWQHDGEAFSRTSVIVIGDVDALEPDITLRLAEAGGASFHLTRACPFGR